MALFRCIAGMTGTAINIHINDRCCQPGRVKYNFTLPGYTDMKCGDTLNFPQQGHVGADRTTTGNLLGRLKKQVHFA